MSRNMRLASGCGYTDYRNNVIYNWGYNNGDEVSAALRHTSRLEIWVGKCGGLPLNPIKQKK